MDLDYIFRDKVFDKNKLIKYGFNLDNNKYIYSKSLNKDLNLNIIIDNKTFNLNVLDRNINDLYLPYYVKNNNGDYVLKIRNIVQSVIDDIITKCFVSDNVRIKVLDYIHNKYKTIEEYPWEDNPDFCTLKKSSGKWYGLIMNIPYKCLGVNNSGIVDVINIKLNSDKINNLVDKINYYPAYHMNKKYWITIILSNNLDFNILTSLIDESYNLVK